MTTEHPQVVSTDRITYDYVVIPPTDTSQLKLRDLSGLFTERSPDLDGYGLPPPVLTTVPRDGNFTNSAHPAPVPRRPRRSGPFSSEGDTRELCDVYSRGVLITPRHPCRRDYSKRSEPEPSLLRDGPPLAGSKSAPATDLTFLQVSPAFLQGFHLNSRA